MIRTLLSALCTLVLAISAAAQAQGSFTITIPGVGQYVAFCGINAAGQNVVFKDGIELPGWTWELKDTDGDGQKDDVRIRDTGNGTLDLVNGGTHDSSGNVHDGYATYPNNQIGTWSR